MSGQLEITRVRRLASGLGSIFVQLDGSRLGKVRNGRTVRFAVAPGEHEVVVCMGFSRPSLPIVVDPGATVRLETGVKPGMRHAFWASLFLTNQSAQPGATTSGASPFSPTDRVAADDVPAEATGAGVPTVEFDGSVQRVVVHSESVRRKGTAAHVITLSRTVQHTIDLGAASTSGVGGSISLGPLEADLRHEISRQLGTSQSMSQTVTHEVPVSGSAQVQWVDLWRTGRALMPVDGQVVEVPIRYREGTELLIDETPTDTVDE